MDFSDILSTIQVTIAFFQLKLDHFNSAPNNSIEKTEIDELGYAIRSLEYAISETLAHIDSIDTQKPNSKIARLWEETSQALMRIEGSHKISHITYQKGLYWRSLKFAKNMEDEDLRSLSLENLLSLLKPLRKKYDRLLKKINKQRRKVS